MQRIVVAVDMSEPSLRAVDLAADLAAKYGAELVLLTIGREIAGPDPGMEAYARMEHIQDPVPMIAVDSMREELAGFATERQRAHCTSRPTSSLVIRRSRFLRAQTPGRPT
jgi:nucleotide-binding universal stress UspA family protein